MSWDARDKMASEEAHILESRLRSQCPNLECLVSVAGLVVYWGGQRPGSFEAYSLADSAGVVLGKLFHSELSPDAVPEPVSLTGAESQLILQSRGRRLVENFWGHYVAFIRSAGERATFVIRDPSGGIPCQITSSRGVSVCFSSLQDCIRIGIRDFSINWAYVRARMVLLFAYGEETGLQEVAEVIPGQCIAFRDGAPLRKEFYWNPVPIAQGELIEDMDEAARGARDIVGACVGAWASGYPRIVHKLSGGIDSSIVLSCLRRAPSRPALTCFNCFESSVWGDERRFARLAAQGTGSTSTIRLIEHELRAEDVPVRVATTNVVPSARPLHYVKFMQQRIADIPIAKQEDAAFFTGMHGDGVFFTHRAYSATDYVYHHGFGRRLLEVSYDTARSCGDAFWKVLPRAMHAGLRARKHSYDFHDSMQLALRKRFVDASVIDDFQRTGEKYLSLPWWNESDRIAPGKFRHLKSSFTPDASLNPIECAQDPDWISPLISQPVVEYFLRIPSYVLTAGGLGRALIRRAFANDVHPQILARRSKGIGSRLSLRILELNESLYKETLLDGVLAQQGYLNRNAIEKFFAASKDPGVKGLGELMRFHFSLEVWLRSWDRSACQSLAA